MPRPNTDRRGGSRSRRRSGSEVRSATSLVRAGHHPGNRQTALNVHKRGVREPLLPDLAGMMAHRAGNSRHNGPLCRLEIPVRSRYLEFVCVQVRVGLGNPAILYAQRPTAGIVRVRWSPVHPIHPQARIHHANPRSPYSGASEGVNGAREAATSVRQPVLGVPRGRGQNPARKPPGSTQTTPGPGRVLRPHVSQFARPVDNLPDLLSLL
jgi:hypothetical protein